MVDWHQVALRLAAELRAARDRLEALDTENANLRTMNNHLRGSHHAMRESVRAMRAELDAHRSFLGVQVDAGSA